MRIGWGRRAQAEGAPGSAAWRVDVAGLPLNSITASHLAVVAVLVGVVLRLREYLADASLWLDEAMLAANLVSRSFSGLFQPLDYDQGAPLGFLFLQKLTIQALGNADYILRLWPLIAGVGALILMYPVARRVVDGPGALLATALFAISPTLVHYSATVKQYSSDVFVALLLLLVGLVALDHSPTRRPLRPLAVGGVLAVWLSHPAVFVLFGIGVSLSLSTIRRKDWGSLVWVLGVIALWSVTFGAVYLAALRVLAANPALTAMWQDSFMPMPPWRQPDWLAGALLGLLDDPGGLPPIIGVFLAAGGATWLLWKRWPVGLMLALPWLATLAASAAQKYPFGERLSLFLVPSLYLFVGGSVALVERMARRRHIPARAIVAAILLVVLLNNVLTAAAHPRPVENIKPLLQYLEQRRHQADVLYVYYGAAPATRYYAPFYSLDGMGMLVGERHREAPQAYLGEVDGFKGRPRVWVLFSHNCNWCQVNEEAYITAHLDALGSRLDKIEAEGAALYVYDLHAPRE